MNAVSTGPGFRTLTRIRRSWSSGEPDAGERVQRGLAPRVDAPSGPAFDRRVRGGHDDRTAVVEERQRLLHREKRPAVVDPEGLVEQFLGDRTEWGGRSYPSIRVQHVDASFFAFDGLEQPVQILEVGGIALHARHVAADRRDSLIQRLLAPTGDEDICSLFDEQLRAGQCHTACRTGDHRHLAVQLAHVPHSRIDQSRMPSDGDNVAVALGVRIPSPAADRDSLRRRWT